MHSNLDYSKIKAISNSSLNLLEISPKLFLKFYNQELEEKDEKYFLLGSAIHCYILEPDEFKNRYIFLNYTAPNSSNKEQFIKEYLKAEGKENDKLLKAYTESYSNISTKEETNLNKAKELKKELSSYINYLKLKDSGKNILDSSYKQFLDKLKKELETNEKAKELLFLKESPLVNIEIYNEFPIIWSYKSYKLKALLDRIIIDHDNKCINLIDLKTTASISKFKESFFKYNYDRQLAFYTFGLIALFEQKYPSKNIEEYSINHFIVAVSKDSDPESTVFKVSEPVILEASKKLHELLNIAIWHFENNKWSYSKEQYINGYETI